VHCKAGLGRTGSLIAAYAMKHFKFPADAFIGYIRIRRPGSVLGPQQQFLCDIQETYFKKGEIYRKKRGENDDLCLKLDKLTLSTKQNQSTKDDESIGKYGQNGQGEGLVQAKLVKSNKTKI